MTDREAHLPDPRAGSPRGDQAAAAAPPGDIVRLRRVPVVEADLIAAKLDLEGIPCFVANDNASVIHPLAFPHVDVNVFERDVARAETVLAATGPPQDGTSAADDEEEGGYVDEPYRCAKCRGRSVDLVPLGGPWRLVSLLFRLTLLLGLIVFFLRVSLPDLHLPGDGLEGSNQVVLAIVSIAIAAGVALIVARRSRRCRGCGHVW